MNASSVKTGRQLRGLVRRRVRGRGAHRDDHHRLVCARRDLAEGSSVGLRRSCHLRRLRRRISDTSKATAAGKPGETGGMGTTVRSKRPAWRNPRMAYMPKQLTALLRAYEDERAAIGKTPHDARGGGVGGYCFVGSGVQRPSAARGGWSQSRWRSRWPRRPRSSSCPAPARR